MLAGDHTVVAVRMCCPLSKLQWAGTGNNQWAAQATISGQHRQRLVLAAAVTNFFFLMPVLLSMHGIQVA